MTYYIRNGNTFRITDESAVDISNVLPVGNYVVKFDEMSNSYYLEVAEPFKRLPKYYGDIAKRAGRVLNTFADRPNSTGVMLVGEKGSGKTLLAKEISIAAAASNIPTILVNEPWKGDVFNKFISCINQPCVVIFDEFEKIYEDKDQKMVLTLFDGVFPTKKLFIVSINDRWKVDSHMKNRPGRFYYYFNFGGLEEVFIRDYCADNGMSAEYETQILNFSSLFGCFNFDMLKAIVEESIRYNEPPCEVVKHINALPESENDITYGVEVYNSGTKLKVSYPESIKNPLGKASLEIVCYVPGDNEDDDESFRAMFTPADFKSFDAVSNVFVYEKDTTRMLLRRKEPTSYDWSKAF